MGNSSCKFLMEYIKRSALLLIHRQEVESKGQWFIQHMDRNHLTSTTRVGFGTPYVYHVSE